MASVKKEQFRPIERWPLSHYTTERQVEGWERDEENVLLNNMDLDSKLAFLRRKNAVLDRQSTHRYFEKLGVPLKGKVLEQGAGICWLSSYLSKFDAIDEIVSLELCASRFESFRGPTLSLFDGADASKIRHVVGDMHRIDVEDGYFDLVVCDAVLHHADNLIAMLRESWRALKPGGWFMALREPTIPSIGRDDPVFNDRYPENGTAYYHYESGWKVAFINAWYVNVRTIPFVEYGLVRGRKMPWAVRRLLRMFDRRKEVYPKICIAAQKPAAS